MRKRLRKKLRKQKLERMLSDPYEFAKCLLGIRPTKFQRAFLQWRFVDDVIGGPTPEVLARVADFWNGTDEETPGPSR